MELPEAARERLCETWPVAILATLSASGSPHCVPVVFARRGAFFFSPLDGKPKRGRRLARLRNLEADPRAALLLERYDADWSRLWWIRIDGVGSELRSEGDAEFEAAALALRRKYPQYGETPLFGAAPTLLRIAPESITSWCAGAGAFA